MNNIYIIYVLHRAGDRVNTYLQKKGYQSFIPLKDVIYKRCNRKFLVQKPLFTNYIFVRSDLDQSHFLQVINQIKQEISGLIKVLTYDKEGTPALKEQERAFFDKILGESGIVEASSGYIENDKVIVTDGPLLGLESKIIALNKHKSYVKLMANLFERDVIVEVSIDIIKKIDEAND